MITIRNLSLLLHTATLLDAVSIDIGEGCITAVIGKNGAGKSTLVRCLAGLEKRFIGEITIDGVDIRRMSPRELARKVAYVPQMQNRAIPFTVFDFIMMSRFSYQTLLGTPSREDRNTVHEALLITDTDSLMERTMDTLSGGELQRVFLAGAVAQRSRILLLDEPTAFLDPYHTHLVQSALKRIAHELAVTIVTVTHDVNSIGLYTRQIIALRGGKLLFSGTFGEFTRLTPEILQEIYGVGFRVYQDSQRNKVFFPE